MDPISFAASLLTLVAAVGTTAKHLNDLREALQHAPDVLSSLVNEVSDLRIVLEACDTAVKELYNGASQSQPVTPLADADKVLNRTKEHLEELDKLISSCLPGALGSASGVFASSRLRWIKVRSKVEKIQQKLRDSKQDLVMLMESQSV